MAKELKEGVYIAQGPETNILIRLIGKAPMLDVIGAIDLNQFYQTGNVVNLSKNSIEVLDIMSCPEKYRFELPSVTSVVETKAGIDRDSGRKITDIEDSEITEFTNKYQSLIKLYGDSDMAENRMILWLKKEKNISISQGRFVIDKIKTIINKRLTSEQTVLNRAIG